MTSQYETNLWSTHVNIVWLGEPISRCVCWRTEVFKIEGFVCKHFLPSPLPPPSFIFWLLFHFSCSQNRSFVLKPNRNACYAGYIELGIYVLLVFTKLGNSIFCVCWLAPGGEGRGGQGRGGEGRAGQGRGGEGRGGEGRGGVGWGGW